MCDPLTIIGIVGGLASSALGLASTPKPPKPQIPAPPAPDAKAPGAEVRVGNTDKNKNNESERFVGFTEQRKQGKSLGGLGRGGLTI